MAKDFYSKLEKLLKKDSRFVDQEEDLLKSNVIDAAYKADKKLVELLLSQSEFKKKFFSKVKDVLVFNINDFVGYIQDKNFLADSYTKYRNKIGFNINGKFLNERKEVALVWPFKDCVLEGGMTKEDEKRKEIFFKRILAQDEIDKLLAPKVLTDWKRYTQKGEEKVKDLKRDESGTIRENLIIKGNNLLALHSLKKRFAGKVKLIYIDPPYNRDAESFYNDSFKHSTWLTFMKNRLDAARKLLRKDGVIFVQCDDTEQAYLKVLMDEIFKRNNFLNQISWERSAVAGLGQGASFAVNVTEWIIVYAKDKDFLTIKSNYLFEKKYPFEKLKGYSKMLLNAGNRKLIKSFKSKSSGEEVRIYKHFNYKVENINFSKLSQRDLKNIYIKNFDIICRPFLIQRENKFQHSLIEEMSKGLYSVGYIPSRGKNVGRKTTLFYWNREILAFLKNNAQVRESKIIKLEKPSDFWTREDISNAARGEGGIKGLDRTKKPEILIQRIIKWTTKASDLVLDFFLGTGTTCAVAHKMGRQYIGIEQLDYGENSAEMRLKNVVNGDPTGVSKAVGWKGGGDFVYCELKKYNEAFVEKIRKAKNTKTFLKIWKEMRAKSFLNYNVNIKKFDETINEFKKLPIVKQKHILFEILNKNQLYVNLSEIEDKDFKVSNEDKKLNRKFYA